MLKNGIRDSPRSLGEKLRLCCDSQAGHEKMEQSEGEIQERANLPPRKRARVNQELLKFLKEQGPLHSFEINEMQDLSQHIKCTVAVITKTDPNFVYTAAPAAQCTGVQRKRASHFLAGMMKRHYSTEEALDVIMESDPKPMEHDTVTSDSDTETAEEDEEYLPGAGSSTSSTDLSDGVTQGPTRYAVARVGELMDSYDLFFTMQITKLITDYTNLHGRRMVLDWKDLDATTVQGYFGLLLMSIGPVAKQPAVCGMSRRAGISSGRPCWSKLLD
ncbi:hypothetical protein ABVT39_010409 [Epinephelus coioides]